jgi:hypothetical protein
MMIMLMKPVQHHQIQQILQPDSSYCLRPSSIPPDYLSEFAIKKKVHWSRLRLTSKVSEPHEMRSKLCRSE